MTIRATITGGTGFIGRHLVRHLVRENWQVTLLIRESSDLAPLSDLQGRIVVRQLDGTTETLLAHVQESRPDIGIHLAAQFLADHQPDDLSPLIENTFAFGCQFAEALTRAGCTRLLNTGTSWQHSAQGDAEPVNLYASLKHGFESVLNYYADAKGLQSTSLLLFDTYGPDDPRPKLFSFLRRAESSPDPIDMSPGKQLLDLVYVDDVASAFSLAATRLLQNLVSCPDRYAVSSGAPMTLREIVSIYEHVREVSLNINWGGLPYRPREVMIPWNSGHSVPGWKPVVPLEEGVKKLTALNEGPEARRRAG